MDVTGGDGSSDALAAPAGAGASGVLGSRLETDGRAPSYIPAAVLCFVAAVGGVLSAFWGVVAAGLVNASIDSVSEYIPDDAKWALGQLTALNVIAAIVGLLVAVGFVVGGVLLLRRKRSGRAIVVVACAVQVIASLAVYGLGRHVWAGIETALSDVKSVEVTYFGPGLASVIWNALLPVVIVALTVWAPMRPIAAAVRGGAPVVHQANAVTPASLPLVSGRTAVTASVLSLVGGAVFMVGVVAGVIGVLDAGLPEGERIISAVVGALAFPLAVGLILGGVLLLRRRRAGRIVLAVMWTLVILLAFSFVIEVASKPGRPPGALAAVVLVVVLIIAYAAITIALAMVSATARWCQARGASRDAVMPVPAAGWAPLAFEAVPASGALTAAPVAGSQRVWVMAAAVGGVVVLAAGTALAFTFTSRRPAATSGAPGSATTAPKHPSYGEQITLPFEDIRVPGRVAVDINGTVYVTDYPHSNDSSDKKGPRVLSLPSGSTTPNTLPFTGLVNPAGVAVDIRGTVYVADSNEHDHAGRVLSLPAGSAGPTELAFTGLVKPVGVAVDADGTVYVCDGDNGRVLSLRAGSATQTELPFTKLRAPDSVAVDKAGTVYVTDAFDSRVLALPSGSITPNTLPFTALSQPHGVAVDANGTVYVADPGRNQVLSLAAGATTQTVLPFTELSSPRAVAVDNAGSVYVTDVHSNASKLPFN
ncbi:NHL repeat-containing protein [Mycobacteroides chelonae]|uniref:NHL repeat-containing protein n=1 Tax=Mycobacteroides chelonae TaxID=1774 RepID=UPI000D6A2EF7|nr:NHL repeat-containing protein [Mycobacteroides chelonae]